MSIFPFKFVQPLLQFTDFVRFSKSFSELVLKKIPTAGQVHFLENSQLLLKLIADEQKAESILAIIKDQPSHEDMAVSYYDCLIFSMPLNDNQHILVLVDEIDPHVVRRFGDDWLAEIRSSLVAELTLLKQARVDIETGLLNSCNLHYLLENIPVSSQPGMVLVSLTPKRGNSLYAIQHVRRVATLLESFIPSNTPLHHLGQSIFAFVPTQSDDQFLSRISMSLIHYLKKERLSQVHVGYSRGELLSDCDRAVSFRSRILDEAWQALEAAAARGPFSFCSYESLAYPDHYLLKRPDESLFIYFRKAWRNSRRFCLVRFIPCGIVSVQELQDFLSAQGYEFSKTMANCLYLYLDDLSGDDGQKKVEEILLSFQKNRSIEEPQFSAGIGVYPFGKFNRSDVILNSRKACAHGEFLNAGSVVVFDAVSLNVSGDIYYAEGDLKKAVKEYKTGLLCSPNDINLLNSLGVAYIFLQQINKAEECFFKVLALDSENFMALYNCGLAAEQRGHKNDALRFFRSAMNVYSDEASDDILEELKFILGRLYCENREYKQCLRYLPEPSDSLVSKNRSGQLYRLTGIALCGIGEQKKGVAMLQRSLRINKYDAEALSVLGEQYRLNGKEEDVALSFCQKSVELEPENMSFLLRLTRVQLACKKFEEAKANLRILIKHKKLYSQAAVLMEQYYDLIGNSRRKIYWQRKNIKN